ncbi:MAG: DUF2905 domain-containing protein [Nitrospiraceae bacterium]|nr:DUF2905 domain-containing protein [Nitrospiraceae bacterium]
MSHDKSLGRLLVIIGLLVAAAGVFLMFAGKLPFLRHLGRLPGDILVKKKDFTFYFPLATSIIISIILTLIMLLFRRR